MASFYARHSRYRPLLLGFLSLLASGHAWAQPILGTARTYTARDLQAASAVYALTQDSSGILYAANNDGLSLFDAATWQLVPTAFPLRALTRQPNGRIFAGGLNKLGYFQLDDNRRLRYLDLVETLPTSNRTIGEVNRLVASGNDVYALTQQGLLRADMANPALPSLKLLEAPGAVNILALTSDGTQAYAAGAAIYRITGDRLERVADLPVSPNDLLAFAKAGNSWVFVTASGQLVRATGADVQRISLGQSASQADIAVGPDGTIWVAGPSLGLMSIAPGASTARVQAIPGLGLPLALAMGDDHTLWIGHSKGVSVFRPDTDAVASLDADLQIAQVANLKGSIGAATTAGAYVIQGQTVRSISGTSRSSYSVLTLPDDRLVFVGEDGVLLTDAQGDVLDRVSQTGIRALYQPATRNLYVGGRTEIVRYRVDDKSLVADSTRIPVAAPVVSLGAAADGSVWVGTFGSGLYQLQGNQLVRPEGLPTEGSAQMLAVGEQTFVRNGADYFRWQGGKLVPIPYLSREAGKNSYFLGSDGQYLAISTVRGLRLYQPQGDSLVPVPQSIAYCRTVQPTAAAFGPQGLTVAYDAGLYTYPDLATPLRARQLLVRGIYLAGSDSLLFTGFSAEGMSGYRYASQAALDLARGTEGLRIRVALPDHANPAATLYRHRIDDGVWTEWNASPTIELSNLPHGSRMVHIEALHATGYVAQASIAYSLPAPWYLSTLAFIGYGIGLLALVWLSVRISARRLEERNHQLELIVQERTAEINSQKGQIEEQLVKLAQQHDELEHTLEELKSTQEQLLQTEKMAALGQLVAGVAHEINTPVGVGVTAASHLQVKSKELAMLLETGQMKKSDLTRFMEMTTEGTQIILQNLTRAADLIQSFKKVAVDQNVEDAMLFDLKSNLGDIILSVRPKMKQAGVSVELEAEEGLEMHTYASALSQVVINLLMNALIHAFDSRQGNITVTAHRQPNNMVRITVMDNGRGIPEDIRPRIFDPFFTTNRGKGGSGLGLHIVFNLVAHSLKGTITVESTVGVGTTFILMIPRSIEAHVGVAQQTVSA